jgi:predicted dehydrogenase
LNILIVGLGSIARKHIIAIHEILPDSKIYALRSSKNVENEHGVNNIFNLNELNVKPDFIIISNPTQLHEDTILKTLEMGCPLFIEKPVLSELKNSEKIIREIQKNKTITYVACNLRFHPAIQFLKKYVSSNTYIINEVNMYCGSYLPDWRPGKDFRKIYSANAAMGGGVHLDLIHELDYCTWLFGNPLETKSVKRNVSSLKIDAVDFASYHLFYETFSANITLNYFRKDAKREIEIVTEKETINANLLNCVVSNLNDNKILFEQSYEVKDTYIHQMNYFINQIKNNQQPMNDFKEAVEVLKIALA